MSDPLRVLGAIALMGAVEKVVLPAFRDEFDLPISIRWDPTALLVKALTDGEVADLLILTDEVIDEMLGRSLVEPPVARLPRAVLGVAVPAGSARPDLSTVAAFTQALVETRSVCFSLAGTSGIYFAKLIAQLGIENEVRAHAVIIPSGLTAERLLTGEATIAVQQMSELLAVRDVDVVGLFPPEVQNPTSFSAAVVESSTRKAEARRLLDALVTSVALAAYREAGLQAREGDDCSAE